MSTDTKTEATAYVEQRIKVEFEPGGDAKPDDLFAIILTTVEEFVDSDGRFNPGESHIFLESAQRDLGDGASGNLQDDGTELVHHWHPELEEGDPNRSHFERRPADDIVAWAFDWLAANGWTTATIAEGTAGLNYDYDHNAGPFPSEKLCALANEAWESKATTPWQLVKSEASESAEGASA